MNDAASLHFEVLSGLYSGLTGNSASGANLIGSGLDSDMVFVEQRLEPHHFRITFLRNSVEVEVEAVAAGISIEGRGDIAAGERVVVPLPVVIHAGTMSILWSAPDAAQGSTGVPRLSIPVVAIVLVGLLGIGALSAIFFYYGSPDALSANSPGAEPAPEPTINRPDDQANQATAKALQQEVDRAGLLNIKIASANGVVTANGTVMPASVARWQKVQQWFDHRTNGALTLVSGVAIKEEKAPSSIAVEAVWCGALPYLLIGGQKYFVGALLDDGWTVDRIEEGRVLLSRNGQLAALPY
ncbi:SctD/MshK family protein [Rhizobium mongolense]|uniref:SctD/MshK family protein n=1 Tax=Rhizobium mongolense TaxID=57676 RepID=UPI0034A1E88B